MMNTTASIHRRTGPAVVKWIASTGAQQHRQFDDYAAARDFAMQLDEHRQLHLWIEFATGATLFFS